jgi:hypothetical protein
MKIAAQGNFWVGVQRKQMSYGTIPLGQMHVQYIIPAEQRHANPVVMVHGGGGQGTHMMGIGRRPGWVHYFVQAGYAVYWVDRPSYGRSPYHADALGPSHLPIVPPYEGLLQSTGVFNTGQWPGTPTMEDPNVNQFMAVERGNVADEALLSGPAAWNYWNASARPFCSSMPSVASSPGVSPTADPTSSKPSPAWKSTATRLRHSCAGA